MCQILVISKEKSCCDHAITWKVCNWFNTSTAVLYGHVCSSSKFLVLGRSGNNQGVSGLVVLGHLFIFLYCSMDGWADDSQL